MILRHFGVPPAKTENVFRFGFEKPLEELMNIDSRDRVEPEASNFPCESLLEPVAAARLRLQTERLRTLVLRTVENLISTGKVLLEVKAELEHGLFGRWLEAEFSWSDRTARNLMGLAEAFGDVNLDGSVARSENGQNYSATRIS